MRFPADSLVEGELIPRKADRIRIDYYRLLLKPSFGGQFDNSFDLPFLTRLVLSSVRFRFHTSATRPDPFDIDWQGDLLVNSNTAEVDASALAGAHSTVVALKQGHLCHRQKVLLRKTSKQARRGKEGRRRAFDTLGTVI